MNLSATFKIILFLTFVTSPIEIKADNQSDKGALPRIFEHNSTHDDEKWIVKFSDYNSMLSMCDEAAGPSLRFNGICERTIAKRNLVVLNSDTNFDLEEMRKVYASDIQYLERDFEVQLHNSTWHLDRVNQRSLPLDGNQEYHTGSNGSGVHIYIVDTGLYAEHEEFRGRVSFGIDVTNDTDNPEDCHGHGTHVAATAAGSQYGPASNSTIHGVKVFDCNGSSKLDDVVAGLQWILENHTASFPNEPALVSMSLGAWVGLNSTVPALTEIIDELYDAGIQTIASAGNEAYDACEYVPANIEKVITVGSIDKPSSGDSKDRVSWFSNIGDCVDIFAPGSDILSASIVNESASELKSGTSMATPLVTGVSSLYLSKYKHSTPDQLRKALINSSTKSSIDGFEQYEWDSLFYEKLLNSNTPNRILFADFEEESNVKNPSPPPPNPSYPSYGCKDFTIELATNNSWEWIEWRLEDPYGTRELIPGGSGNLAGYGNETKTVMICDSGLHILRLRGYFLSGNISLIFDGERIYNRTGLRTSWAFYSPYNFLGKFWAKEWTVMWLDVDETKEMMSAHDDIKPSKYWPGVSDAPPPAPAPLINPPPPPPPRPPRPPEPCAPAPLIHPHPHPPPPPAPAPLINPPPPPRPPRPPEPPAPAPLINPPPPPPPRPPRPPEPCAPAPLINPPRNSDIDDGQETNSNYVSSVDNSIVESEADKSGDKKTVLLISIAISAAGLIAVCIVIYIIRRCSTARQEDAPTKSLV